MQLNKEEVKHIALLTRLGLNESELEQFQSQLSNILENFEILKQINTDDLPPTTQMVVLKDVFREDISQPSYPTEDILANSPRQDDNFIRVQAVLE